MLEGKEIEKVERRPNAQILIDHSMKGNNRIYLLGDKEGESNNNTRLWCYPVDLTEDHKFRVDRKIANTPIPLTFPTDSLRSYPAGTFSDRSFVDVIPENISMQNSKFRDSPMGKLLKPFLEQIDGLKRAIEAKDRATLQAQRLLNEFGSHVTISDQARKELENGLSFMAESLKVTLGKQDLKDKEEKRR